VVEVRLMLPAILDERSKELLREFGQINSENVRDRLETSAEDGVPGAAHRSMLPGSSGGAARRGR
jgi:hypothetical protein